MIIGNSVFISNFNDIGAAYGGILVDYPATPEDVICTCTDMTTGQIKYSGFKGAWLFPCYNEGEYLIEISTKDPSIKYKVSERVKLETLHEVVKVKLSFETLLISTKIQTLNDLKSKLTKKAGNAGDVVQSDNQFLFSSSNSLWQFNEPIDLTDKNTITFKGFKHTSQDANSFIGLAAEQTTTQANGVAILNTPINSKEPTNYELDVSGLSGNYFIGIRTGGTANSLYCTSLSIK